MIKKTKYSKYSLRVAFEMYFRDTKIYHAKRASKPLPSYRKF